MNKTFKKIAASIMAVTTLAVSMVGMSTNAADTTYWKDSTSGNKTTRSKYTTTSIVGSPQYTSLSDIGATMTHSVSASKVNSWSIVAVNLTSSNKYMYARAYATNRKYSTIVWDTYTGDNRSIASGGSIGAYASATYSTLPADYTLWYEADISAGGEPQSPSRQGIVLEERLTK